MAPCPNRQPRACLAPPVPGRPWACLPQDKIPCLLKVGTVSWWWGLRQPRVCRTVPTVAGPIQWPVPPGNRIASLHPGQVEYSAPRSPHPPFSHTGKPSLGSPPRGVASTLPAGAARPPQQDPAAAGLLSECSRASSASGLTVQQGSEGRTALHPWFFLHTGPPLRPPLLHTRNSRSDRGIQQGLLPGVALTPPLWPRPPLGGVASFEGPAPSPGPGAPPLAGLAHRGHAPRSPPVTGPAPPDRLRHTRWDSWYPGQPPRAASTWRGARASCTCRRLGTDRPD